MDFTYALSDTNTIRNFLAGGSNLVDQFKNGFPSNSSNNGSSTKYSSHIGQDSCNPGCAGDPSPITVLSYHLNQDSETPGQNSSSEIYGTYTTRTGKTTVLKTKSLDHFTSKQGDKLGIDDKLPPNPNQRLIKLTKSTNERIFVNSKNQF